MLFGRSYKSHEVFGISSQVLEPSYVNRGDLDAHITRLLERDTHIALRGESKCGKSWIRQQNLPDAITIQCRLKKSVRDLYADALSQLGLKIVAEQSVETSFKGTLEATQEIGVKILAKLAAKQTVEGEHNRTTTLIPVGCDLDDLRFVSEIINASGRRLVIEDFHYLSPEQRTAFAFDMKALWDYQTFVIVIGIWAENNLLIHLNPDLSGRIEEVTIHWSSADLQMVLIKGALALNIEFDPQISSRLIADAFGTVGILQRLALSLLDEHGISNTQNRIAFVADQARYEGVAMQYADQLNALYQTFATRVTKGIRQRRNSTGIYAHMLKVVMSATDQQLTDGFPTDEIFRIASAQEARIKKANLGQILVKIDGIQVDDEGRGLILTFDGNKDEVFVVDKQLFFYRKYATTQWPWERIIEQAEASGTGYEPDES